MRDLDPAKSLAFHRFLLADTKSRLDNYQRAISQTVAPGHAVLDLGAGIGILSFMACQAGARVVYAVEAGDIAEVGKLLCAENDLENRVMFFEELSAHVNLPERADVLVTDIFGTFGLQQGGLASVIDARKRLLNSDAVIIPSSIELFVTPVEVPDVYLKEIDTWKTRSFGMDLSLVRRFAVNNTYTVRLTSEAFLGDPVSAAQLQFFDLKSARVHCEASVRILRSGVLNGVGGWFTAELAKDLVVSNEPGNGSTNYAQIFFPVERPVRVTKGDDLRIVIDSFDGAQWRWRIEINGQSLADNLPVSKGSFDHSTFWAFPLSKEKLRKRGRDYQPIVSRKGSAELFILTCLNGEKTIEEIENDVLSRFPVLFKSRSQASALVKEIVDRSA